MDTRILLILLMTLVYVAVGAHAGALHQGRQHHGPETTATRRGGGGGGGGKPPAPMKRKKVDWAHRQRKKDMFVSRGWGAGGMPFSVLYLNPTRATAGNQQAARAEAPRAAAYKQLPPVPQPQARQAPRNRQAASQHSVIPQLFVSYNWAPMGRK